MSVCVILASAVPHRHLRAEYLEDVGALTSRTSMGLYGLLQG
jgi:hypothetical protein